MSGQPQNLNVAMFIDADNAPSRKIGDVLAELASYGSVSIRRAYGNWKNASLDPWGKVLHEHAIQPMQQFDLVKGKNATDMAMAVDAMDVLFNKPVDVFCLVSSDCDFTPLVMRLRAEGKQVVGFGERKAAEPFVNACSRFLYFDQPALTDDQTSALITHLEKSLVAEDAGQALSPARKSGKELKGDTKLLNLLRNAVAYAENEDGWAHLSVVGSRIGNQASFDSRNYGYPRLVDLFAAIDLFEMKRVNNHPQVRNKRRSTTPVA
ncbi:NYN domain-containing protein [Metapseudomonas furukawaii]|uniref:NYN domain-containing protein n=1 Tax=Metapseudomonas furukawaii TaxID=1149133 RepID=UPI00227D499C|nr:NYN domain-containing protein [Pseudomonas furukawaii]WAG79119.1 NYN domain-containing protein [Pseudomonas furukawaii]